MCLLFLWIRFILMLLGWIICSILTWKSLTLGNALKFPTSKLFTFFSGYLGYNKNTYSDVFSAERPFLMCAYGAGMSSIILPLVHYLIYIIWRSQVPPISSAFWLFAAWYQPSNFCSFYLLYLKDFWSTWSCFCIMVWCFRHLHAFRWTTFIIHRTVVSHSTDNDCSKSGSLAALYVGSEGQYSFHHLRLIESIMKIAWPPNWGDNVIMEYW